VVHVRGKLRARERGYLLKPQGKPASIDQIAGELDIHDSMITSLVEMLEEKGQLKYSEWENRLKKKISPS
jgi:Mn-dependent DtxR family transcriptional regulator